MIPKCPYIQVVPLALSSHTLQSFWYRGEEMAILWSLCRKTTTFWREVRTMAIILRLLQVCSSLLLVIRMLALPYPAHIVSLPHPFASQPTKRPHKPKLTWFTHTRTHRHTQSKAQSTPIQQRHARRNTHQSSAVSVSLTHEEAADKPAGVTFSSRTITLPQEPN